MILIRQLRLTIDLVQSKAIKLPLYYVIMNYTVLKNINDIWKFNVFDTYDDMA